MLLVLLLRCAALMAAPAAGAVLYALLDKWIAARRHAKIAAASSGFAQRNRTSEVKRRDAGAAPAVVPVRGTTGLDDALAAWLEYCAHVCAFLLLSASIVLVSLETAERMLEEVADVAILLTALLSVGTMFGALLVWGMEASPVAAALRSGRHLPQGLVVALVMFAHAAMEGCVLGLLYARDSFPEIFLSVVLHNVPEGFVVGVSCFKPNASEEDDAKDCAGNATTPTTPLCLSGASLPQTATKQQRDASWRAQLLHSLIAAVGSHVGQALALAVVAIWMRGGGGDDVAADHDDGGAGASNVLGCGEVFMTGLSIGSMVATVWYELLPDVCKVPQAVHRWLWRFNRRKKEE